MHGLDSRLLRGLYCVVLLVGSRTVLGQQSEPAQKPPVAGAQSSLPEAPSPKTGTAAQTVPADQQQTKRIMGMLPNFRSVSAGEVVPKETARQKLVTATEDNFDYTSLFFAGFIAADSFASKSTPEFHQGAAGFARYYWHTVADQAVETYFVELIVPAIAHQDSRYYAMGKGGGGVWKRAGYSLSRVLVTRTDAGKRAFNISEVAGSAAAVSVSTFYYPSQERTPMNGLRNWGLDITYDSVTFVFHEFWPDIHSAVFKRKSGQVPAAGPVKGD